MNPIIIHIGIHGEFGSGKDTLANWLQRWLSEYAYVEIVHFAGALRTAIEKASRGRILARDTWTDEGKAKKVPKDIDWDLKSVFNVTSPELVAELQKAETVGQLLAAFGMMGRRLLGDDVWVDRLPKVPEVYAKYIVRIYPDLRFPNEAMHLYAHDGFLVHLDVSKRALPNPSGRDRNHISERALDGWTKWEVIVDNNGSLAQFEAQAKTAVLYRINARLSGRYLTLYERTALFIKRAEELEKSDPFFPVPPTLVKVEDIVAEEFRRGLLGHYAVVRQDRIVTLVKYLWVQEY